MTTPTVVVAPDAVALAYLAADYIVRVSRQCGGPFCVALSGGNTPRLLYELLASEHYRDAIAWEDWHVFFTDERAVPPVHPASNFGMVKRLLLSPVGVPPSRVHRMCGEADDISAAAEEYEQELRAACSVREAAGVPTFDLVLLGIGKDGHTASLFPRTQALREEDHWVVANYVPELGEHRLTLTYPTLAAAHRVAFLVAGKAKAATIGRVLGGEVGLPATRAATHPRAVLLLDRGAASALPTKERGNG